LGCYDSLFRQSGLTPGRSHPAAPAPTAASTSPPSAADQFGLTSGQILRKESQGAPPAELKEFTGRLTGVSRRQQGYLVLRLDNGQVWEQTEAGPELRLVAGDAVRIERGVLGAYWLLKQPGHLAIKVRRTG